MEKQDKNQSKKAEQTKEKKPAKEQSQEIENAGNNETGKDAKREEENNKGTQKEEKQQPEKQEEGVQYFAEERDEVIASIEKTIEKLKAWDKKDPRSVSTHAIVLQNKSIEFLKKF